VQRIRCSQDQVNWTPCGSVFRRIPEWVSRRVPGVAGLWAPDISHFAGLYHLYYSGSPLGSQRSVIGLATNTTLDPADPSYRWVDRGEVLQSAPGDDFNAIDPNILIDAGGGIWLTYGSYWSGIKQMQINPRSGGLLANSARFALATRPGVPNNPIEGAAIIHHGNFYYLFVSIDYCCNADNVTDNYKQAMGRATTPNGPFVDMNGTAMMDGGGTVILAAQGRWNLLAAELLTWTRRPARACSPSTPSG
jgi:arabinan endo-1,5-alpha-L-arabinosidase